MKLKIFAFLVMVILMSEFRPHHPPPPNPPWYRSRVVKNRVNNSPPGCGMENGPCQPPSDGGWFTGLYWWWVMNMSG